MATITFSGLTLKSELASAWPAWREENGHTGGWWDNAHETGCYPYGFAETFAYTTEWAVPVRLIDRDLDRSSPTFNEIRVWIEPDAITQEMRERVPAGLVLTPDGCLHMDYKTDRFVSWATMDFERPRESRFGYSTEEVASAPTLSVVLTDYDAGTPIHLRPLDVRIVAQVIYRGAPTVTFRPRHHQSFHFDGRYRDDPAAEVPEGSDLWEAIYNRGLIKGFCAPRAGSKRRRERRVKLTRFVSNVGTEANLMSAAGHPEKLAGSASEVKPVAMRGRALILDDLRDKNSIGKAPGAHVYGVANDLDRPISLIALGLSADRSYFTGFDMEKHTKAFPAVQDLTVADDAFWNLPVDRFVFQRSTEGFHGMFLLSATAHLREPANETAIYDTDRLWLAYCVPVFLAHKDARPAPTRFRRLPEELRRMVNDTFGLADFLNKALLSLQGAMLNMRKKGLSLDGFEVSSVHEKSYDLPKGHGLRTWGVYNAQAKYEADRPDEQRYIDYRYRTVPYKSRAASVAAMLGLPNMSGQIPVMAGVIRRAVDAVQPVATRTRMLEV